MFKIHVKSTWNTTLKNAQYIYQQKMNNTRVWLLCVFFRLANQVDLIISFVSLQILLALHWCPLSANDWNLLKNVLTIKIEINLYWLSDITTNTCKLMCVLKIQLLLFCLICWLFFPNWKDIKWQAYVTNIFKVFRIL